MEISNYFGQAGVAMMPTNLSTARYTIVAAVSRLDTAALIGGCRLAETAADSQMPPHWLRYGGRISRFSAISSLVDAH